MKNKKHLPLYGIGPILCLPLAIITFILFLLSLNNKIPTTNFGQIINTIFGVIGVVFIIGAVALLIGCDTGGRLSTNIKENRLKTNGSYRFVRNPRYCTFLLVETGMVLLCHNLYLLIIPLIFWLEMTIVLKKTEEKWLTELYGKEYTDYCKRANRCIPWSPKT
jgi:protein-S-isoprenylcysteine O-methyltransferase Ste14